jgi:hypothetical protein
MDLITSSIVGGIIYDSLKYGTYKFSGILREKLKNYLFEKDELEVIENIVEINSFNKDTNLDIINSTVLSSDSIQKIINNKNIMSKQVNTLNDNYGAIVGNNTGKIKININK